jgi:hypothetical protein
MAIDFVVSRRRPKAERDGSNERREAHCTVRTKRAWSHALNGVAKKHDASAYPPNGSGHHGIVKPRGLPMALTATSLPRRSDATFTHTVDGLFWPERSLARGSVGGRRRQRLCADNGQLAH